MREVGAEVRAALARCEDALLWPEASMSTAELELLLADGFHEIGASGRRWDREFGLATLRERRAQVAREVWTRSDERMEELSPGLVLLTYRLERADRCSMRATVWRRRVDGGWESLFHQGTACSA